MVASIQLDFPYGKRRRSFAEFGGCGFRAGVCLREGFFGYEIFSCCDVCVVGGAGCAGGDVAFSCGGSIWVLGPHGSPRAAWGDWAHFVAYCGVLNSFAPKALIPALAWIATGFEIAFGVGLLIGYRLEYVAYGAAGLFALFALAMTWSLGVKAPLDYSVFADAGGALLLGALVSVVKAEGRSERGSYGVTDARERWAED